MTLGRIGALEARLACSQSEIAAAQALRYRVFVEEMGANPMPGAMQRRLDIDSFDAVCDHLLAIDRSLPGEPEDRIVGTYRLLRDEVARAHRGFYSASEFQVAELIARHPDKRFLELGRSCVLAPWRTRRTAELLWQGNWAYARRHGIDVMFGCASLPGASSQAHAPALSFLHHRYHARDPWTVSARPELKCRMDLMPATAVDARAAFAALPPMLKGYLRLGAVVGDGAVIDRAFATVDVMVVLPVSRINPRYLKYYGADAERFAA